MDLTNEEKKSIAMQHAKGTMLNIFNLQMSLAEENALTNPDQSIIDSINKQISEFQKKLDVMTNEIQSLDAAIAAEQTQG